MASEKEWGKARTAVFVAAVFLTTFVSNWQLVQYVIINDLYVAFPQDGNAVTAMMSWPSLFAVAASLISGYALERVSAKSLLVLSSALMCVFGFVVSFTTDVYVIMASCFVLSIAGGMANTAGMAAIGAVFVDERTRSNVMGYYNAATAVCGAAISFIGGILAVQGWQIAFRLYWFAPVVLLASILFIPSIKPEQSADESDEPAVEATEGSSKGLGGMSGLGSRLWIFILSIFVFQVAFCFFYCYISVYVSENALGDTVLTGTLSTINTVFSFLGGLVFGRVFAKLRRSSFFIYIGCSLVALVWLCAAPSVASAVVAAVLYGFSYGSVATLAYAYAACCVPQEKNGLVMGLMTCDIYLAIFVGTYLAAVMMGMLGSITATFPYAAGILVIPLVIEVFACRRDRREGFLADESSAA